MGIMDIHVKANKSHRYWTKHFSFIDYILTGPDVKKSFTCRSDDLVVAVIDGAKCIFDYSDFNHIHEKHEPSKYACVFKMHYSRDKKYPKNVYPFTPISFHNWEIYADRCNQVKYKAEGYVSMRQRCYGDAVKRRHKVHVLLDGLKGVDVDLKILSEHSFFMDINNILVSVCVPGASNNMLDRGQLQYMGLGACTISPRLPEVLPYNKVLIPNVDYIQCKDDYSDLEEKIQYVKDNKEKCIMIGKNAQAMFKDTCTPTGVVEWVRRCVHGEE